MSNSKLQQIVRILESSYGTPRSRSKINPFSLLVHTVLSQNTSDINSSRAFSQLTKSVGSTPQILSQTPVQKIQKVIRVAGLYRVKAPRIKKLAKIVMTKFNGDLQKLFTQPLFEARKYLLSLPGVGFKTADILLLFYGKYPILPLDTHCLRVASRLGYSLKSNKSNPNYEQIRTTLESELPRNTKELYKAHILLITHGRTTCKAQKPLCPQCPLQNMCWYYNVTY